MYTIKVEASPSVEIICWCTPSLGIICGFIFTQSPQYLKIYSITGDHMLLPTTTSDNLCQVSSGALHYHQLWLSAMAMRLAMISSSNLSSKSPCDDHGLLLIILLCLYTIGGWIIFGYTPLPVISFAWTQSMEIICGCTPSLGLICGCKLSPTRNHL